MGNRRRAAVCAFGAVAVLGAALVSAGELEQDAAARRMAELRAFHQRLSPAARAGLSGAAQNLFATAADWDAVKSLIPRPPGGMPRTAPAPLVLSAPTPAGRVSDPAKDLNAKNTMAGFVQGQSHTAWCNKEMVVGFLDTGSAFESAVAGGGISFAGYSVSTDGGVTFHDQGFLNPGTDVNTWLLGGSVVACTDASTFYQSSLLSFSTDGGTTFQDGVSVSKSTDGGQSFAPPVVAASIPAASGFLDKQWLAADPTDPNTLYVTYTDFDTSGTSCVFFSSFSSVTTAALQTTINIVQSVDGGATWSAPTPLDTVCDNSVPLSSAARFVQGSQVAVDNAGNVPVAWVFSDTDQGTGELRSATAAGGSYVRVAAVVPPGLRGTRLIQGHIFANFDPALAVDRSGKAGFDGDVYLAWTDGSRLSVNDFFGTYSYGDIFVVRSTDGGLTWPRLATRVNTTIEPSATSMGSDQFNPGIAIDKNGAVGVCWYDRRNDPNNWLIDRYCAKSLNHGGTWTNLKKSTKSFIATVGQDPMVGPFFMGDYDGVATDFLKLNLGFKGAYGDTSLGNLDLKINAF